MEIKPKSVQSLFEESPRIDGVLDRLKAAVEKEAHDFFMGSLVDAGADIVGDKFCVVVEGWLLLWPVADLLDKLILRLDDEPEEIEETAEALLPTLKRVVAELESRSAKLHARP